MKQPIKKKILKPITQKPNNETIKKETKRMLENFPDN